MPSPVCDEVFSSIDQKAFEALAANYPPLFSEVTLQLVTWDPYEYYPVRQEFHCDANPI